MNQGTNAYRCKSPVAFMVFNRPETTRRVFAEISKAHPHTLLIVADGPRKDRTGEAERCAEVRKIVEGIDWDCRLLTNFAEDNMGCMGRISSGIDWVFANVEEAIFLEDDCLPHPSFFRFCDELLKRYRNDERIMTISGDNFQFGRKRPQYSYYFSRYVHIWGWASWRRAWKHYDVHMSQWPAIRDGRWLDSILEDRREAQFWTGVFDRAYRGETGTWDYQWVFACWLQSALSALPNVNLISNIGFGADATHTDSPSKVAEMATEAMAFPLVHPPELSRDAVADRNTAKIFFQTSVLSRTGTLARQWLGLDQHRKSTGA